MSGADRIADSLGRSALAVRTEKTLHRGGAGNPDVLLVRDGARRIVVKDYAPRAALVRLGLGRWLLRREERAYRVLAGLPAVPRLLGRVDDWAFALEYRPGERLSRSLSGRVPEGFLGELRAAVVAMHQRGVVHLDLRHRSNLLMGEDGHPVILDYASSFCFRPGGWLARWLLPWLARLDLRALDKWEIRLGPASVSPPVEPPEGSGAPGAR